MLHGDISNQASHTIAFRCENCLFKLNKDKKGIFSFIRDMIPSLQEKYLIKSLNEQYLKALEFIYRETPYTADLVIEEKNYTPVVKKVLENVVFNRVILIRNESAITVRLNTGDISIYVDEDSYRRSLVNHKEVYTLAEANTLLKRRF